MSNYDPKSLDDIIFQNDRSRHLIDTIIAGQRPFPQSGKNGILLYGVVGTGKTALAHLLPNAIEKAKSGGETDYTFERIQKGNDATTLLNRIANEAHLMPIASHRYFVLDEVDNLTSDTMKSLKSVMNITGAIFILTTNNLTKVERGVQDRCHLVEFNAAPTQAWLPLAKRVIADQNVPVPSDDLLLPIIATCQGSARNVVDKATEFAIFYKLRVNQQKTAA
jgi:replication-associated recombination protein RarA